MATVDEVVDALDRDGWCVVEGVLDAEQVARTRAELLEVLERTPTGRNDFEGFSTRRIYALFAKTRAFDDAATHPLLLGVLDRVLGHYQLSAPTGIQIGPGEAAQVLHRDQSIYPLPAEFPDVVLNTMWAFDDFTEENGATRVVPGSHLRTDVLAKTGLPAGTEPVAATGRAGSALVFDGRLWHGTGKNTTGELRYGVLSYHCRPWIRQQENHFLALPDELVAGFDERLLDRLGWKMWAGLGKTGQGQQDGDQYVARLHDPVRDLAADGRPLG